MRLKLVKTSRVWEMSPQHFGNALPMLGLRHNHRRSKQGKHRGRRPSPAGGPRRSRRTVPAGRSNCPMWNWRATRNMKLSGLSSTAGAASTPWMLRRCFRSPGHTSQTRLDWLQDSQRRYCRRFGDCGHPVCDPRAAAQGSPMDECQGRRAHVVHQSSCWEYLRTLPSQRRWRVCQPRDWRDDRVQLKGWRILLEDAHP